MGYLNDPGATKGLFTEFDITFPMWLKAITAAQGGVYIDISVNPGSMKRGLRGHDEWRNRIAVDVRAEPKGGRANSEVISMFAELLGVKSSDVMITSGHRSRQKRVFVGGVDPEHAIERIGEVLGPG